jgi:hypothetical protein
VKCVRGDCQREAVGWFEGQGRCIDHLDIADMLDLTVYWLPGKRRSRWWSTWDEYFEDTDRLRSEISASDWGRGKVLYADKVRAGLAAKPGSIWASHGGWQGRIGSYIAIRHAHAYRPGDEHRHDDDDDNDGGNEDAGNPNGSVLAGVS